MKQYSIIVGACNEVTEQAICEALPPRKCKKLADNRLQLAIYAEPVYNPAVSEYWDVLCRVQDTQYIAQHKQLHVLEIGTLDELLDMAITIEEALHAPRV